MGEGRSYLAAIDFTKKKIITFIDTFEGLSKLTVTDEVKMEKVKYIANRIQPAGYTINMITDCVFHTCLFAKCLVRKDHYHKLNCPCRREVLYELLKGELI